MAGGSPYSRGLSPFAGGTCPPPCVSSCQELSHSLAFHSLVKPPLPAVISPPSGGDMTALAVPSDRGEGEASVWTLPCHICGAPCRAGFQPPAAPLPRCPGCLCTLPWGRRAPRQLLLSLGMDIPSHMQSRETGVGWGTDKEWLGHIPVCSLLCQPSTTLPAKVLY